MSVELARVVVGTAVLVLARAVGRAGTDGGDVVVVIGVDAGAG